MSSARPRSLPSMRPFRLLLMNYQVSERRTEEPVSRNTSEFDAFRVRPDDVALIDDHSCGWDHSKYVYEFLGLGGHACS